MRWLEKVVKKKEKKEKSEKEIVNNNKKDLRITKKASIITIVY